MIVSISINACVCSQIQQTQTNNTSLWKQLKDAESQSAAFSSQLSTQRLEFELLKRDLELKNSALEQSQNNATQLQSQSLQLQQIFQQTNADKVRLEHELTEMQNKFNALQKEFNDLSTQSSAVALNLSHNHSELQREKASNQALTVQVASNEQLIRTLTSQNSQLLSQIEEFQQTQVASQAALQQANSELSTLRQTLESSQLTAQKFDSELQSSRQKNVELAQSLSQLLSEARESKQLSESLQLQHQLSVQQINVLRSELTQCESDSREKTTALTEAQAHLIEARNSARQFQEAAEFTKFELKSQQEIVSVRFTVTFRTFFQLSSCITFLTLLCSLNLGEFPNWKSKFNCIPTRQYCCKATWMRQYLTKNSFNRKLPSTRHSCIICRLQIQN
jgi:chromosome segregation ATPase